MNYIKTSGTPASFFKEIAQMYEQNVNDPNNSVFTIFQASHNQGFTESLL